MPPKRRPQRSESDKTPVPVRISVPELENGGALWERARRCIGCVENEVELHPVLDITVDEPVELEPEQLLLPEPELEPEPRTETEDPWKILVDQMQKIEDQDVLNLIIEHLKIQRESKSGSKFVAHPPCLGGNHQGRAAPTDVKWYGRTTSFYRHDEEIKLEKEVVVNLSGTEEDIGIVWEVSRTSPWNWPAGREDCTIKSVKQYSPAYYKMQLKRGQILTHINGVSVYSRNNRTLRLWDDEILREIKYNYNHDGVTLTLKELGYNLLEDKRYPQWQEKRSRLYVSGIDKRPGAIYSKTDITQEIIEKRRGAWSLTTVEVTPPPHEIRDSVHYHTPAVWQGIQEQNKSWRQTYRELYNMDIVKEDFLGPRYYIVRYDINDAIDKGRPLEQITEDIMELFTRCVGKNHPKFYFEFIRGNPEDEYTVINERARLKPKKHKKSKKRKKTRKNKSKNNRKTRKKKSKNTRKRKKKD